MITYWNRGAEELYGWQRAEAVGRVGSELRKTAVPLPLDQIKAELLRVGRWEGELVNNKRDGTPVLVTSRWSLQRDRHGRPATILVTSNDITERKRAEQALRESEEQWREVFEHNPVMYFMVSPTGTVLSVNGFGAAQLGYTAAELIGQSVLNVFFEEDRELVKAQLATCVEELGRSHSWEIRKIRKDGTVLWVRENAKAVRRSGNDAIVLIACEDITERRRSRAARRGALYAVTRILAEADSLAAAAPHLLRAIGENLEWDWGALWSFDARGCPAPLRLPVACAGYRDRGIRHGQPRTYLPARRRSARSGLAKRITNLDGRCDDRTRILARARRRRKRGCMEALFSRSCSTPKPSGSSSSSVARLGNATKSSSPRCRRSAARSASSSSARRAEAALRASEERWRRLFETSSAGMALFRLDGVCTAANPALQRMLGRSRGGDRRTQRPRTQSRGRTRGDRGGSRAVPERLADRASRRKEVPQKGRHPGVAEHHEHAGAGNRDHRSLSAGGLCRRHRSACRLEAALRASEERWRAIFDSAAVGIAAGDLRGGLFNVNPTFQRMLGYTEEELRNLTRIRIYTRGRSGRDATAFRPRRYGSATQLSP